MTQKNCSLKDQLFNREKVEKLSLEIFNVYDNFKREDFVHETMSGFADLELKERLQRISKTLEIFLPDEYEKALDIILGALPKELSSEKRDDDFGDFIYAPYGDFIARNGSTKEYYYISMNAIKECTKRFSMEDHIREFINKFEEETLSILIKWSRDDHYHVRRLTSEGTRQKLPWCRKIHLDYKKTKPILDNLHKDNTRYVTRSVANHLNDITKFDHNYVLNLLSSRKKDNTQIQKELDFIASHSLRTSIKAGHLETLNYFGYSSKPNIEIKNFRIKNSNIQIPGDLEFSFDIKNTSTKKEKLVVDYKIYFLGKLGNHTAKVFKIKSISVEGGESMQTAKKHPLKIMTTKKLYPGEHLLELQINGNNYGKRSFQILLSSHYLLTEIINYL